MPYFPPPSFLDLWLDKSTMLVQIKDQTPEIHLDTTSMFDFILHSAIVARSPILTGTKSSEEKETKEPPSPRLPTPPLARITSSPTPLTLLSSWSCQLCTFANELSASRCEMCGTENPTRVLANEDDGENVIEAQENNPLTPGDYAVWMCGQCTYMNQMENMR
jgi:hypothetical protein